MRLNFDSFEFDAGGLPRVYSLRVTPSHTSEGPVTVSILLDSCQRSAVAKWADRLGVEVVDVKPYQPEPGEPWVHTFEAVLEAGDCRVRVWTSLAVHEAPEPAAAEDPARGETATTALMHLGDLVAGEWAPACGQPHGADVTSERAAVTCPACLELLPPSRRPEPGLESDGGA